MSLKGQNPPLAGLHRKKPLDILCAQAPADEGVERAPTALASELPQAEGGGQTPAAPLGYPWPLISAFGGPTHPGIYVSVFRRIQEALGNRVNKWALVVHDVQNMGKVPLGLNNES